MTTGHRKFVRRVRRAHPAWADAVESVAYCTRPGVLRRQKFVVLPILLVTLLLMGVLGGGSGGSVLMAGVAGGVAGGIGAWIGLTGLWWYERRKVTDGMPARYYLVLVPDRLLVIGAGVLYTPGKVLAEFPRGSYRLTPPRHTSQTVEFSVLDPGGRELPAEAARSGVMAPNGRAVDAIAAAGYAG